MDELNRRKTPRCVNFDYSSACAYFVTICTKDRRCILSRIVGTGVLDCPRIELTEFGRVADKYINQLNDFYDYISVESYVIMPDHLHILMQIKENQNTMAKGQSGTPVPTNVARANSTFSKFISTFKRFCNREYGCNIWQSRSYDHVIRDREDYDKHRRYIFENPKKWYYKHSEFDE